MFVLILIIFQAIILLGHFLIYEVLHYFVIPEFTSQHHSAIIFTFILLYFLNLAAFFSFRFKSELAKFFYKIGYVWIGTIWFLFSASVVVSLVHFNQYVSQGIFLLAILISILSIINGNTIRMRKYEIELDYLPSVWKNKKIILFSDLHLGNMREKHFCQKIVQFVLSRRPDIIFVVGDIFDGPPVDEDILDPLREITNKRNIPLGSYFVTGNHEEFEDPTYFLKLIRSAGFNVLDNQTISIDGITIAGVDYRATEKKENFEKILYAMLSNVDKQTPIVLLKHTPAFPEVSEKNSVDLTLHGHTHKGQMWPWGLIARRIYKGYEYGLKKFKEMNVLTTSGVGTFGPPQRFLTNSEIVEIIFK